MRLYTMTGGRTRPSHNSFDLIAYVEAAPSNPSSSTLPPEHRSVLGACRRPLSVAEIAAHLDLPLGVLRVLLSDLLDRGMVRVREPMRSKHPNERLLREVLHGLQAL